MTRKLIRLAAIAALPVSMAVTSVTNSPTSLAVTPAHTSTIFTSDPWGTLRIGKYPQLQSDGTILLTVEYSCNVAFNGTEGSIYAFVMQPGVFRETRPEIPATCDDHDHMVSIHVFYTAESTPPNPFTAGSASAHVEVRDPGHFRFTKAVEVEVIPSNCVDCGQVR